jgi:hypothetical protein
MISQISFHRMLYVGIGLIAAVAVILAILALPPSTLPQTYITPFWIIVIVHLLIIIALIWTIKVNKRGDDRKELQILAGVALIIMSFILLDWASGFHDRPEQPLRVSFSMFICVGCDIVVGLLILILRYFRRTRPLSK